MRGKLRWLRHPGRHPAARGLTGICDAAGSRSVRGLAGAKEAVVGAARVLRRKLFALAQALTVDYERFETIVGKGERSG